MAATPLPADDDAPAEPTPWPFVIAFGLFVVFAVFAYQFLKDDDGRLVAPSNIQVVADDTVALRFDGPFRAAYADVTQVGFAVDDDTIYVELVLDEYDCDDAASCGAPTEFVRVEVVLPITVDGRPVEGGSGRSLLECTPPSPSDAVFRCR